MGMGDNKKAERKVSTGVCGKCGHRLAACTLRKCPWPAVWKYYGNGKEATMCIYCCRSKCKYAYDGFIGVGCSYPKEGVENG